MTDHERAVEAADKHKERLEAILRELWAAKSLDLHMCDGTTKQDQFGLLRDLREDVRAVLSALAPQAGDNADAEEIAKKAADAVGVTPYSDMRPFVVQAVKYALASHPCTSTPVVSQNAPDLEDKGEWILVPKNPTEEMIKAGESWSGLPSATWQDMLDAAPMCDEATTDNSGDLQAAYNTGFQDAMGEASQYFMKYTSWAHLSPGDLETLYKQFKEDVELMYPGPYSKTTKLGKDEAKP
ncbi:hypothetical protein EVB56_021 [Rhizobium phage RHph_Y1_10]|nr:hypothetical protein EVB56_021 [Rhizobium phage RHph_Y1_10]